MAYVEAIAAQAGLNLKAPRWDDGVDLEVGSNKALRGYPHILNLYISLQLKSTINWEIQDGHIHFPLKATNYDRLRDRRTHLPQYLILYTLPQSRSHWIRHDAAASIFRERAYFLSLLDLPTLAARPNGKPRSTKTVRVPSANRLTACSLLGLFRDACEAAAALRDGA